MLYQKKMLTNDNMTRLEAITKGVKVYSGNPCVSCGSTRKYVINWSCSDCTIRKSKHKLSDTTLMAPYRTKEKENRKLKNWRANNPEMVKAQNKRARPYQNSYHAKRRVRFIEQTPANIDMEQVKAFYIKARQLTEDTGIPHEVDHILPIVKGGLHHQDNLQILTRFANRSKGGR